LQPDDDERLRDKLNYAMEATQLASGKCRVDLNDDRLLELGLTRLVEIVGEAASRVTQVRRGCHDTIPWLDILGMRNRLAHGYDIVDLDTLWDTVTNDLPPLIKSLRAILEPPISPK
jgi:uncharacterized protein with HEPN domain